LNKITQDTAEHINKVALHQARLVLTVT